MTAYNNAVKRWATKLTLNGKLTYQDKCYIWLWLSKTNVQKIKKILREGRSPILRNSASEGLDEMLKDIFIMSTEMVEKITNRFLSDKLTIENPSDNLHGQT